MGALALVERAELVLSVVPSRRTGSRCGKRRAVRIHNELRWFYEFWRTEVPKAGLHEAYGAYRLRCQTMDALLEYRNFAQTNRRERMNASRHIGMAPGKKKEFQDLVRSLDPDRVLGLLDGTPPELIRKLNARELAGLIIRLYDGKAELAKRPEDVHPWLIKLNRRVHKLTAWLSEAGRRLSIAFQVIKTGKVQE